MIMPELHSKKLLTVAIVCGVLLLTVVIAAYLRWKLDGLTGDTYGAINEIAEAGVLAMAVLLTYNQWLWIT